MRGRGYGRFRVVPSSAGFAVEEDGRPVVRDGGVVDFDGRFWAELYANSRELGFEAEADEVLRDHGRRLEAVAR